MKSNKVVDGTAAEETSELDFVSYITAVLDVDETLFDVVE